MIDTSRVIIVDKSAKSCRNCVYYSPYGLHVETIDCLHPISRTDSIDLITARPIAQFSAFEMRTNSELCGIDGQLWTKEYPRIAAELAEAPTRGPRSKTIGLDDI
jgi:hypothetical protein